jgi:DNA invertase Pin-like site-specific DNA recombinase
MKTAIIWGRFSSIGQSDGDSKSRQLRNCRAFAASHGIKIIKEVFDEASSAKGGATALFHKTISELPKGCGILTEELDRISRGHSWRTKAFLMDLIDSGIWIITINDGTEYSTETIDKLSTTLLGDLKTAVAHEENSKRTKRVKEEQSKVIQSIREGKPASLGGWLPPYIRYNKSIGKYDIDIEKQKIVQRIFDLYLAGDGCNVICKKLNEDKIPTPRKGLANWQAVSVSVILRNENVIGNITINGERFVKVIPPAISDDDFYKVQELLKVNTKRHGKYVGGKINNLFRGLTRCEHCGHPVGIRINKMGKRYYICRGHIMGLCNISNHVPVEFTELHLGQWLIGEARKKLFGGNPAVAEVDTLTSKRDACNSRIEATLALLDSGLELSAVKERLNKLQTELKSIENELREAKSKIANLSGLPEKLNEMNTLMNGIYDDEEAKRKVSNIAPLFIKEIQVDLKNRYLPVFNVTLTNGSTVRWEYDIIEWSDKYGVIEGSLKPTK